MARGWESKSVEEQQSLAGAAPARTGPPPSPGQQARRHQQQGLQLSRQRVLQQLTAALNPRHREMLEKALADIEARLTQLG